MAHTTLLDESNGNGLLTVMSSSNSAALLSSLSNEDLSQSLSEYTDADESMSAPTEFLAEFLSAVMLKDYKNALKYCTLILQFEPNNTTAKEFHPLILAKLEKDSRSRNNDSDENDNTPSPNSGEIEPDCENESSGGGARSATGCSASESSLDSNITDSDFSTSDTDEKDLDASNSNTSNNSIPSDTGSDNTTHSYSSLLLEEEDDDVQPLAPNYLHDKVAVGNLFGNDLRDVFNGNGTNMFKSTSCSDSESPTEPLTQKIGAILRGSSSTKSADT